MFGRQRVGELAKVPLLREGAARRPWFLCMLVTALAGAAATVPAENNAWQRLDYPPISVPGIPGEVLVMVDAGSHDTVSHPTRAATRSYPVPRRGPMGFTRAPHGDGDTWAGGRSEANCVGIRLPDVFHRRDDYLLGGERGEDKGRIWGRVVVKVDGQSYACVVPSSLFKYTHGITDSYHKQRLPTPKPPNGDS